MTAQKSATFDFSGKRVWVTGHNGMVGSALMRRLACEKCQLLTAPRETVDLRRQVDVECWMEANRPDAVFVAAARVGGILANSTRPAEFLYDNLAIEINVIEAARRVGVGKLLFLASSCVYPRLASQPMAEEALLTGPLEPTNESYALAKIAGIMLCRSYHIQYGCDFISATPTNVYGPGDNFDPVSGHVIAALVAKAYAAKQSNLRKLTVWGTGTPRREFIYVDDVANALVFLMTHYSGSEHINVGVGYDLTIKEIAQRVMRAAGIETKIWFDSSKPDGMPRKLVDSSKLFALGWKPRIELDDGLRATCEWYEQRGTHPR